MRINIKYILFIALFGLLTAPLINTPSQAEEEKSSSLFNHSKKAESDEKKMKTLRAPTEKEEKIEQSKETVIDDTEILDDLENDKSADKEEELTPEQKLWEKYKNLADQGNTEENEENSENKEDEQKPEKLSEEEIEKQEKAEKASTGIKAILEKYKQSQENSGGIKSRSFGGVD